jgi:hypothetical protein
MPKPRQQTSTHPMIDFVIQREPQYEALKISPTWLVPTAVWQLSHGRLPRQVVYLSVRLAGMSVGPHVSRPAL